MSVTSLTNRKRSASTDKLSEHKNKRSKSRSKSKNRIDTFDQEQTSHEELNSKPPGHTISMSPSPIPAELSSQECHTNSTPSSSLSRKETIEPTGNIDVTRGEIIDEKQTQSLILGLKTLSPLSSHLINPVYMIPGTMKGTNVSKEQQSIGQSIEPVAEPPSTRMDTNEEYNVSFTHSLGKPPPLPKKEFPKPKLVINEKIHTTTESDLTYKILKFPASKILKPESQMKDSQIYSIPSIRRSNKVQSEIVVTEANSIAAPTVVTVNETMNAVTLPKRRKDKRPPPIPRKSSGDSHLVISRSTEQDSTGKFSATGKKTNNSDLHNRECETSNENISNGYVDIRYEDKRRQTNNINEKASDASTYRTTVFTRVEPEFKNITNDKRTYSNSDKKREKDVKITHIDSIIKINDYGPSKRDFFRSSREPLSIEIRPYETRTIVTGRSQ